jgi:hypothetical protein
MKCPKCGYWDIRISALDWNKIERDEQGRELYVCFRCNEKGTREHFEDHKQIDKNR